MDKDFPKGFKREYKPSNNGKTDASKIVLPRLKNCHHRNKVPSPCCTAPNNWTAENVQRARFQQLLQLQHNHNDPIVKRSASRGNSSWEPQREIFPLGHNNPDNHPSTNSRAQTAISPAVGTPCKSRLRVKTKNSILDQLQTPLSYDFLINKNVEKLGSVQSVGNSIMWSSGLTKRRATEDDSMRQMEPIKIRRRDFHSQPPAFSNFHHHEEMNDDHRHHPAHRSKSLSSLSSSSISFDKSHKTLETPRRPCLKAKSTKRNLRKKLPRRIKSVSNQHDHGDPISWGIIEERDTNSLTNFSGQNTIPKREETTFDWDRHPVDPISESTSFEDWNMDTSVIPVSVKPPLCCVPEEFESDGESSCDSGMSTRTYTIKRYPD